MNASEALEIAEASLSADLVLVPHTGRECEFGFYFATDTKQHSSSGRIEDLQVGSCGVLVDRRTGEVHSLGSAFNVEYWLKAYQRGLYKPLSILVTKVFDLGRAAESLLRLQLTETKREKSDGDTWPFPQLLTLKELRERLGKLPAKFENQNLIFRLHEIERIETERDLTMEILAERVA